MNKFFYIAFLVFFLPQNLFAATHHGDEHKQLFHAFTLEAEAGNANDGKGARGWDLDGWIGNDVNRLWIKSEKKTYGEYEQKSEVQALYSRNISQFWDAQIGIRHDFSTDFSSQSLNYLNIGIEGLAPYFFETDAHVFLSEKGNVSARLKQEFDILITQKFIMQPFVEADFFVQDVKELNVSSGLSVLEVGALVRYEISRKFAPYFSLRYNTKTFATKNLSQKNGEPTESFILGFGLRLKF